MDAIVVIILVVAVSYGAKRGLLESLAGLVIVFMALAGAGIAAGTFAEPVTEAVTPLIEERVAERVREAVEAQTETVEWNLLETAGTDPGLIGEALELLGLDDDRPLLLTYWGSLGAEVMNRKMVDFIARECYEGAPFRHIHGAGRDFPWMQEALEKKGLKLGDNGVEIREYIYDMPLVMAAADVVLCRAGASTISELTAIAKPSILVPSPNVTANHQEKNARVLSERGAAVLLLERECSDETLYETAVALLCDRGRRKDMSRALTEMGTPDAGEQIFQTLVGLMK
jgi:UDP-N-acetylglucosamine:LPS N-acetylglucosamine transferase